MKDKFHRPPRLPVVFQCYQPPLYFLTFCTLDRRCILAADKVHEGFCAYAHMGGSFGVGVGHYVIMPDHVHLFVRISGEQKLGIWVRGLKRAMWASVQGKEGSERVWQADFFDHLIRNNESYSEK
jgi:REP element-mobilizing transposase RayT